MCSSDLVAGLLAAAAAAGELPADLPPDGAARLFIAIYQGLALQTAWDDDLDHEACVRAVEVVLAALTGRPASLTHGPGHG